MKTDRVGSIRNVWPRFIIKVGGAGLLALLTLASSAWATVINVNFTADAGASAQQLNDTYYTSNPLVSPLPYVGNVWNDVTVPGGALIVNHLAYSDSALGNSSIGFSTGAYNGGSFQAADVNNPLLELQGNAWVGDAVHPNSAFTQSITLTGLNPNQRYDLYIAGAGRVYQGGRFIIGSTTKTTDHSQDTLWAEGVNYVEFSYLQPTSDGKLTFTVGVQQNNSDVEGVLSGFQITESIPEPSSIMLLSLGGFLLWRRRRNR